jgi:hypothetical protein
MPKQDTGDSYRERTGKACWVRANLQEVVDHDRRLQDFWRKASNLHPQWNSTPSQADWESLLPRVSQVLSTRGMEEDYYLILGYSSDELWFN